MLNKLRTRRADEGFTLVELLIVIIILGILAAIVVFAVGGITDHGQTSACKQDAKSLESAEEAYFAQNSSYTDQGNLVPKYLHQPSTMFTVTVGTPSGSYTLNPIAPCTAGDT